MSYRHQDENILAWLRDLKHRVERLEKGDKGVRVNDTRIGDAVLKPNTRTNQLELQNLSTGDMVPVSGMRDITWSWPGDMDGSFVDTTSPTICMPDTTIANEIVISRTPRSNDLTECVIAVVFPGFEIHTAILANAVTKVRPINVHLQKNDLVYLRVVASGAYEFFEGAPNNVSVTLRFGEPSEFADNTTVETMSDNVVV